MAFSSRGSLMSPDPKHILVAGRIQGSIAAQYAFASQSLVSGSDLEVYIKSPGVAGNSYTLCLNNTGLAKASLSCAGLCTNLDSVFEVSTGGTAGNSWSLTLVTFSDAAGGKCYANEDVTAKRLTLACNIHAVAGATVSDVEALFPTANIAVKVSGTGANKIAAVDEIHEESFSGGTPHCWAKITGLDATIYYVAATTVLGDLKAPLEALGGGALFRSSLTGAETDALDVGDDSSASPNAFAGGLEASGTTSMLTSTGPISVSRMTNISGYITYAGYYKLGLPWTPTKLIASGARVENSSVPIDLYAKVATYSGEYVVLTYDKATTSQVDHASAVINFWAIFEE